MCSNVHLCDCIFREREEDKEMAEFLRLKLMPLEKKLKVKQSETSQKHTFTEGQDYCLLSCDHLFFTLFCND